MTSALLYGCDPATASPSEGEVSDWIAFDQAVKDAGVFVHEAGLQPVSTARTVSVRDGEVVTEDGRLAAFEVIAGYFLLDVADAEAAADWGPADPHRDLRPRRGPPDRRVRGMKGATSASMGPDAGALLLRYSVT